MTSDEVIEYNTHLHEEGNIDYNGGDHNSVEAIQAFATNPMMERVQRALKEQLQNTYNRIKRDSLEKQQELRNAKKEREDCGVELYGMQQQLARLQCNLDSTNENYTELIRNREKAEQQIEEVRHVQVEKKEKLHVVQKAIVKRKAELDDVLTLTKQAKRFNQETKNEAAISRRAASKAEETVAGLQKGKMKQDLYIDSLNERIKSLEQDTHLTEKELSIQKNLTADADKVIQETVQDLKELIVEKKYLVQQWDSSILALGRRDQALNAVSKSLKKVEDTTKDHKGEIKYLIREIKKDTEEIETMMLTRDRLQNEAKFIEEELNKIGLKQESSAERFEILSNVMAKTLEEEALIQKETKKNQSEIVLLMQQIENVTRDRKDLEQRTEVYQQDQKNISQTITNLSKKERLLASQIHEHEIEAANIQNELARLKIDALNVEAHISSLDKRANGEKNILDKKDETISTLETEIRRRHNDIQSKMNKVDRLNRKYEQMLDGVEEEEPLGPLESTIKALQNEIHVIDDDIQNKQKQWITSQTTLLKTIDDTEASESKARHIAASLNILNQKRLRLIQNIHTNEAELKIIQSRMNTMHTDMSRLNDLIGKNTQICNDLTNNNSIKEMEATQELKELEYTSGTLELKIMEVKNDRDQHLMDILNVEKQILSWEKKIHLEKEIQTTLNSSDYANEMKGMEKEIHRMKHKLDSLKREQEKMVREMELAIHKKEDIAVKYQHAKHGDPSSKSSNEMTIAELKKRKCNLLKQKKDMEVEKCKIIKGDDEMNKKGKEALNELSIVQKEVETMKKGNNELQHKINNDLFEKQRVLARKSRVQAYLKKFHELEEGKREMVNHKTEQVKIEQRLASVDHKVSRIKNAIAGLRIQHSKYDEVFNRVQILIDDE